MSRRLALALLLLVAAGAGWAEGVTWGWLGVRIRDLTELEMEEISSHHGIQEGFGALIVEVLPETPAARDGLRNGDLVVAFKDRPVVDTRSLQRLVATTPTGEEVSLTVLRGEEGRRGLTVRVGAMPREVVAERIAAEFGFVVQGPLREQADRAARPSTVPTVVFVLEGSAADRAGLKSGDVIVEVNGWLVLSRQAVTEALRDVTLDQPLRLTVRRAGEPMGLTVAPPSPGTR